MIKRYDEVAHPSSGYGSSFFDWIHIFFVAVVVAGVLNCFFGITNVSQFSMSPTFNDGDKVCLNRSAYWFSEPKAGDIILFYESTADTNYVKRVIGVPGDTVQIKKGYVYVNGLVIDEPYIEGLTPGDIDITVPEDKYFCLGDNRSISIDSRDESIGCIAKENILGKVVFSLSPFKKVK